MVAYGEQTSLGLPHLNHENDRYVLILLGGSIRETLMGLLKIELIGSIR
jgi:hypothetical protein